MFFLTIIYKSLSIRGTTNGQDKHEPWGAAMHTYEVRICIKDRWTTEYRCFDKAEALKKGDLVAVDRSLDGVQVVAESYDEEMGVFKEKILFSYFKQEKKVAQGIAAATALRNKPVKQRRVPRRRRPWFGSYESRAWMMVTALLFSLGANLGLAMLIGGDWAPDLWFASTGQIETELNGAIDPKYVKGDKLVIYNLPTVTMNFGPPDNFRTVKVKLGLELTKKGHAKNIEDHLSKIIASVANRLGAVEERDLYRRQGLINLRKTLHDGVRTAAGGIPVENVLFREIIVF